MINTLEFIVSFPEQFENHNSMGIEEYKALAKKEKRKFLKTDFKSLESEHPIEFAEKYLYYISLYSIFIDKQIAEKLREMGLSDDELRWFASCSKIERELDNILKTNMAFFVKSEVLLSIRHYFFLCIIKSISKNAQVETEYFKAIDRLVDRKETNSRNTKRARTEIDELIDRLATSYNQRGEQQFVNRKLKTLFSGSISRRFLAPSLKKQIHRDSKLQLVDFYLAFFELARLLLLDEPFFLTQEELDSTHHYSYEKIKEHRARKVRDHLFPVKRVISAKRHRRKSFQRK